MTLTTHKFERGDRVKADVTMGWLAMDTIGLVTAVYEAGSDHPDAFFSRDGKETIIVAWPRQAYLQTLPEGTLDWDGSIEGFGSVDLSQFKGPTVPLPMLRHEITFIDNLIK